MSKDFNLLLLHSPSDVHPRSWICLKGTEIRNIFRELEKDVLRNQGWCREKLSRKVGSHLNCSHSTIKWVLQGKHEFYPIPIILGLLKFSKNKEKILKQFKDNIEYLKVNSASAKPVRGVYKLNKNLAKILGAFMADGSLSIQVNITPFYLKDLEKVKSKLTKLKIHYSTGNLPSRNQYYISIMANKDNLKLLNKLIPSLHLLNQTHYSLELTDEYKDSVEAFIKWIKEEFGADPNRFKQRSNAWRVSFSNKILARYLMRFFEVKPGPKAYSAFEPKIIKTSNLAIRKAFAKGILMFDGCVTVEKKISFGTVSRNLFTSIKQIWGKDNIKFGKSIGERKDSYNPRRSYTLFSLFTTAENKKERLLEYFERETQKWKLLKWLSGDTSYNPIIKGNHSLSLEKLVKVLQKIKICDAIFLKNYFKCAHTTIRTYLKILKNQGKIKLSNQPCYINDYVDKNTMVLLKDNFHSFIFKKIREKFRRDKNFARFLGIHKATLSNWRLKKSRIPVYILKSMCKILDIDFNKVSRNIITTDREIAEII